MKNVFLEPAAMRIAMEPARWNLVGTAFSVHSRPLRRSAHQAWMAGHTESHPAREILFVLKGQGRYGFMGQVYSCPPGTAMFFDAYEPHDRFYPPSAGLWLHLWIRLFECDVAAHLLHIQKGRCRDAGLHVALANDPAAAQLSAVWDECKSDRLPRDFSIAKVRVALASLLLRIIGTGFSCGGAQEAETFQRQVVATIRRHVARTTGKGVPLAEAARLAGYSKFHFLRLFKQESGLTFHDYVNECRRRRVAAMLRENKSKTEISNELGFSHPSAFLRWMKHSGQLPHSNE